MTSGGNNLTIFFRNCTNCREITTKTDGRLFSFSRPCLEWAQCCTQLTRALSTRSRCAFRRQSRSAVSAALLVPSTRNRLPAALRSPELSLASFKRQSSAPALHVDSAGCSCVCRVPSLRIGAVVTVQRVRRRDYRSPDTTRLDASAVAAAAAVLRRRRQTMQRHATTISPGQTDRQPDGRTDGQTSDRYIDVSLLRILRRQSHVILGRLGTAVVTRSVKFAYISKTTTEENTTVM